MATRWRWPPESSAGLRFRYSVRLRILAATCTRSSISFLSARRTRRRERHVLGHRHVRVERVALEYHGDVARLGRQVRDVAAVDGDRHRRSHRSSPAMIRSSVDFPQPDGPTSTRNSPSAMASSMSCSTCTLPKAFATLSIAMVAMREHLPDAASQHTARADAKSFNEGPTGIVKYLSRRINGCARAAKKIERSDGRGNRLPRRHQDAPARTGDDNREATQMAKMHGFTRRQFTRAAGRTALLGAAATLFPAPFVKGADPVVINHWSWLSASDGEVWQKMIDSFNDAHKTRACRSRWR
jgi:hypothetical protein